MKNQQRPNSNASSLRLDFIGAILFCLVMLMGNIDAFAASTNAVLISESVPTGAQIMPRTIFTQTWTFENTGTATWTPTYSGYTLNIIGEDSLGAAPLVAKPYVSSYVSASIGSGQSIAPGVQAAFTMSFIAPEAAGTYTDTFQLNSSSSIFFGPTVTVQVVVMQAGSTNQYDRARAVSYANNYSAYVCSDGYFWTNSSFFASNLPPGSPAPKSGLGDDCAHFVSCCIGSESHVRGGGLNIYTRDVTYGEPGAGHLIYTDLVVPGWATEVSSLSQLEPGDVIGWNWEGVTNADAADIDHVTIYLGNGLVASHSASDLDVSATTWYNGVHHYIHIFDSPTITAFKVKNNLVLSWETNWTDSGYVLYSSASLAPGATWSKVAKSPVKKGNLDLMTNTMSGGAMFYRLEMP